MFEYSLNGKKFEAVDGGKFFDRAFRRIALPQNLQYGINTIGMKCRFHQEQTLYDSLEKAKKFFADDLYATRQTGIVIEAAEPGYAKCSLKIEPHHKNAMGNVMGGVYFTMADYAFAIAANLDQRATVTQTSQIVYLSPAKGSVLCAETERIRAGRTTCLYKIMITDDTGAQVAYVTTTGIILQ